MIFIKKTAHFGALAVGVIGTSCSITTPVHRPINVNIVEIAHKTAGLTEADIEYLRGVYADTFKCLGYYSDPDTGFPYDVSDYRSATSICNIGLYAASVATAGRTGLISENEAIEKLDRILSSVEKIQKWRGFPITWVNVKTIDPEYGPKFSYADHTASLICGLLVADTLYPEKFSTRISDFVTLMDFASTYDSSAKKIKGGYNLDKNDFDVNQPWGTWYYSILASDTRHFGLLGMALGKIPGDYWQTLNRSVVLSNPLDKEISALLVNRNSPIGNKYYWPGIEGGGLFMQYLPGIFLMEKDLPMGKSARTMALGEIELSKANGYYPIWGLSACETPDGSGYLGWGSLKKTVFTPHASVLAINDFPLETLANLRALEKKGMRSQVEINGNKCGFGFTDSFDIETGVASKHYLSLDQAMLFLSLANFLYDDIVRNAFVKSDLGGKTQNIMDSFEKARMNVGQSGL